MLEFRYFQALTETYRVIPQPDCTNAEDIQDDTDNEVDTEGQFRVLDHDVTK
jgi:hypothetical protein